MGTTYSYLVGDFASAPQIADRNCIVSDIKLSQKVIGISALQSLEGVLSDRDSGLAYWGGNDPAVCFAKDEDGPFVIRLPRPLVEQLATLPLSRMQEIAELWTATDAFVRIFPAIARADLLRANILFLGDLARLARSAESSGQDLLMLAE